MLKRGLFSDSRNLNINEDVNRIYFPRTGGKSDIIGGPDCKTKETSAAEKKSSVTIWFKFINMKVITLLE